MVSRFVSNFMKQTEWSTGVTSHSMGLVEVKIVAILVAKLLIILKVLWKRTLSHSFTLLS